MPSPAIPRLPRHLATVPACRADYAGLLALRRPGQWSALEVGQVQELVARMHELRGINDRLGLEGLTVTNLAGRTTSVPAPNGGTISKAFRR